MIADVILTIVLSRGGDAPIPPPNPHGPPGHRILYAYDDEPGDWAAQREECRRILATDPPGSTCVVKPGREIVLDSDNIADLDSIAEEMLARSGELRRGAPSP